MKLIKRVFTIILVAVILSTLMPSFQQYVWAASSPVKIYVDSYKDGKLNIRWDKVSGANSYAISYHTPDNKVQIKAVNSQDNTYQITDLQDDYIYDFKINIYSSIFDEDSIDSIDEDDLETVTDNIIGEGLLYYLPRVSFSSDIEKQTRKDIESGGFEIGDEPKIKLEWNMPKVWVEGIGYINANRTEALEVVRDNLEDVYKNNIDMSKFNFRINISSSEATLNSGAAQSAIFIEYSDDDFKYIAYLSNNNDVIADVQNQNGKMSLTLVGRKDTSAPLPEVKEPEAAEGYLPNSDILPGTVYYMNIRPLYQDNDGNIQSVISVAAPGDFNGSILKGDFPYTYTPIRFQLTKDSANNIYVKIYRINQGSLDLPRLYYEVQSSNDRSIEGDWIVKKTIDDSYFVKGAESALTVISGVGVNNENFYKIVVKTDTTNDRIESRPLNYKLAEDISKSPVPVGVTVVDRKPVTRSVEVDGKTIIQKSSDITISWEKPANWDEIRANTNIEEDVVYHVMFNVSEYEDDSMPYPELKADDTVYGYFPLIYRKALYFSSKEVKENGNRLEYTIDGFDLFKGYYYDFDESGNAIIRQDAEIRKGLDENEKNYPNFLLPNKVYYLKMYTTSNTDTDRNSMDIEKMSDKSLTISFTTRTINEIDVPLPKNMRVVANEADVSSVVDNEADESIGETTIVSNYVDLQFDKVDLNWSNYIADTTVSKAVYYDFYMSTRTDLNSFIKIGTTEDLEGDIKFVGAEDAQSTSIRMTIREFANGTIAYTNFGSKLKPNTTYYFIAKTRLRAEGMETERESDYSSLLSVTTVKGVMGEADETLKLPYAPVDFQIALDEEGNQILTSTKVTFKWTREESDVVYNIISSSRKIAANEKEYEGNNDAIYQSFLANFGEIILDPSLEDLPANFEYDPVTKECRYTIDKWLSPNKLYYFSIKAIKKDDNTNYSPWVSIPVTTNLIEQPAYLEAVADVQLGFYFDDGDIATEAKDYSVHIKSEKDLRFNLLKKDKYTIIKFGTLSYVRLINLQANTYYDIRVYKNEGSELVYTKDEMYTRDSYHQLEIKWRGLSEYRYEVAIKSPWEDDYILLDESNFEEYTNTQGRVLPYYGEKNTKTSGTDYEYYYARIKSIPVKLVDGSYENQPLKSNTKYYIKVRAKKVDSVDLGIISYSKYLDPIFIRTDFSQEDYDSEDRETKTEASFLDRIKRLEEALFWRINIKNQAENKLLLKGDRVVNEIENSGTYIFTLDISHFAKFATLDQIYIPVEVIKALELQNKSLLIRTNGAEYSVRPNTFDLNARPEIKELKENNNIKGIYLTLNIGRSQKGKVAIPNGFESVSYINELEIDAVGTSLTYTQFKAQIQDRLYNKDSGLVQKKLEELLNKELSDSKYLDQLMNESISDIEIELSEFIYLKMEGGKGISPITIKSKEINSFDNPMLINLNYNEHTGLKLPYIRYYGSNKWQKLNQSSAISYSKLAFNVIMTGEYAIFAQEEFAKDLLENYYHTPNIRMLLSKYDLSGVFGDMRSFLPEDSVKVKEIILLYETIIGLDQGESGLTINQKAQRYNLESLIAFGGVVRDVSRQETAKVIMMMYSAKTGVNTISLIPNSSKSAKDMSRVDKAYYKDVLICVDLGLIELNDEGRFIPDGTISRAELATAFVKLLKLTGDI